jgi:hypothetical protein
MGFNSGFKGLKKGCFTKKWKKVRIIPITKTGKKIQWKYQNSGQ